MPAQMLSFACPHCGHSADVDSSGGDKFWTCPNPACGKPFQVDVPMAQPIPKLILPADNEGTAAAVAVPIEQDLRTVHPEMFRRYPIRFGALVFFFILGTGGFLFTTVTDYFFLSIGCAMLFLFCMYRLLAWWLRTRNTSLTITNQRSILKAGILSLQTLEILHREVREVRVIQDFQGRIFNVGDLVIQGNEKSGRIIYLKGVSDAEQLAGEIRARQSPTP